MVSGVTICLVYPFLLVDFLVIYKYFLSLLVIYNYFLSFGTKYDDLATFCIYVYTI